MLPGYKSEFICSLDHCLLSPHLFSSLIWLPWLRDIRSLDENLKRDLSGDFENAVKLALELGIKEAQQLRYR